MASILQCNFDDALNIPMIVSYMFWNPDFNIQFLVLKITFWNTSWVDYFYYGICKYFR